MADQIIYDNNGNLQAVLDDNGTFIISAAPSGPSIINSLHYLNTQIQNS